MFLFYSGSFGALMPFNAAFEIAVYAYGLALAAFFIAKSWKFIVNRS